MRYIAINERATRFQEKQTRVVFPQCFLYHLLLRINLSTSTVKSPRDQITATTSHALNAFSQQKINTSPLHYSFLNKKKKKKSPNKQQTFIFVQCTDNFRDNNADVRFLSPQFLFLTFLDLTYRTS